MLEDLYRDTILQHYQSPSHRGRVESPDAEAFTMNPLCGDEMRITARIDENAIADVAFEARGCSISQASADMMADVVKGQGIDSLTLYHVNGEAADGFGDLAALQHVKKYPVRVKCALLPWNTLIEALRTYESSRAAVRS